MEGSLAPLRATPVEIIEAWNELGMSEADLVRALGIDSRTLRRWRSGESYPQHDARAGLASLDGLRRRLLETFDTPDAARIWLHASNRYLGGLTPADSLRVQRFERFEAALEALDSGIFV